MIPKARYLLFTEMYQFTYETNAKYMLYQMLLYTMDEDSDGRGLSAVSLYPLFCIALTR